MNVLTNCEYVQLDTLHVDWNKLWSRFGYYSSIAPATIGYLILRHGRMYSTFLNSRPVDELKRAVARRNRNHIANYFNGASNNINTIMIYCYGFKPRDIGVQAINIDNPLEFAKLNSKVQKPILDDILSMKYTMYNDFNGGLWMLKPLEDVTQAQDTHYKGLDIIVDNYVPFPNQFISSSFNTLYASTSNTNNTSISNNQQLLLFESGASIQTNAVPTTYTQFKQSQEAKAEVQAWLQQHQRIQRMVGNEQSKWYFIYLYITHKELPFEDLWEIYRNNKHRVGSTEHDVLDELWKQLTTQ